MTRTIELKEILKALEGVDTVAAMEDAFERYSSGQAIVPPVGELLFDDPPGDAHIKYGCFLGDDVFVIKVATGFYDNPKQDLAPTSGLVLVFSQKTGFPLCVLLDEGHLTNLRTAAAGAVAAKNLAPSSVERIAVLGTGQQARLQVEHLSPLFETRQLHLWGRRTEAAEHCQQDLEALGYEVALFETPAAATRGCQLVVTATASVHPLLDSDDIDPGTHITAMGSDTEDKQELSSTLVARADVVVADSRSQCLVRGEIHHAVADDSLAEERIVELGEVIARRATGRQNDAQITLCDLTGVAVQDIAIAKAVLAGLPD